MDLKKTHWSNRVEELRDIWVKPGMTEYRLFMMEMIKHYLDTWDNWKILDAGCGNGLLFEYLPERFRDRYIGIDFTPEMIQFCRERYPEHRKKFKVCDISFEYDKIPDANLTVTQNVIQHILVYQLGLKNLIARCHGILILCERTHNDDETGWTTLVGRNPERWRFAEQDFLDTLKTLGKPEGFNEPEVIGRPRSTGGHLNVLSVYRMKKIMIL